MNARLTIVMMILAGVVGCSGDEPPVAEAGPASQTAGETVAPESDEEGHVELTAEQIEAAGLEILPAGPQRISEVLPLYGTVVPNAERVFAVSARFPGLIRAVPRKIGDTVREGSVLATIESNESLRTYDITAPISGVITARDANVGEQSGDRTLFTVADLSTVWVEVSVFPRDATKVKTGQRVRIRGSEGGISGEGQVVYVAPFGTSTSQTLTARVLLQNQDRRWAPGLYVVAEVVLAERPVTVAIKNDAVQTVEDETVVFVRSEHGFESRAVSLGQADSEFTEIVSGLQAGDAYVAQNSFILKAELGKGEAEHGH